MDEENAADIAGIYRSREVMTGAACIRGTRVPTRAIMAFAEDGYTIDQIMREYPNVSAGDVRAAVAYELGARAPTPARTEGE